jgi:glycosyltransferase involved in cell wall biosynthesis
MMAGTPLLSLIVPAYNAAAYIDESIGSILETLTALEQPFEVIVVCDGSTDGTPDCVRRILDPRVRILSYRQNRGKGYAICFGVANARGRFIGWLDADLDISPAVIVDAVRRLEEHNVDAVIGSKRHPDSQVHYPFKRRFLSWGFQMLVRLLFRISVRDTQVGAKVFRGEMLRTVVPLLLIKQYAFDLEVLAVGAEFGFDRIEEAPIALHYRFTGTGITKDTVQRMFIDTLAIAYRIHLRHWYVRQFAALQRARTHIEAEPGAPLPVPPSATWSEIVAELLSTPQ